jgi:hypothetical protein
MYLSLRYRHSLKEDPTMRRIVRHELTNGYFAIKKLDFSNILKSRDRVGYVSIGFVGFVYSFLNTLLFELSALIGETVS